MKLFEEFRAAASTEAEPFADVAVLWLWEFGAELTDGEKAALRRRGIPFDQKLKLR